MGGVKRISDLASARALFAPIADHPREICVFAYLARDGRLLGMRHRTTCSASRIDLSVRMIAADAIAFGASRVAMAHNHPSHTATPSAADISATRRLAGVLGAIDVTLVEHLVLSADGCTSLRSMGIL